MTTGTAPDEMMSASTWPGPTKLIDVADDQSALVRHRLISDCISMTSTMEVSSTTSRSQSSALSSCRA
jgi:hypothetical protein